MLLSFFKSDSYLFDRMPEEPNKGSVTILEAFEAKSSVRISLYNPDEAIFSNLSIIQRGSFWRANKDSANVFAVLSYGGGVFSLILLFLGFFCWCHILLFLEFSSWFLDFMVISGVAKSHHKIFVTPLSSISLVCQTSRAKHWAKHKKKIEKNSFFFF